VKLEKEIFVLFSLLHNLKNGVNLLGSAHIFSKNEFFFTSTGFSVRSLPKFTTSTNQDVFYYFHTHAGSHLNVSIKSQNSLGILYQFF